MNLLKKASLIIWDEAPMVHMYGFEAFDKSLKNILSSDDSSNCQQPFGGKTIVFVEISNKFFWLTKNMRLTVGGELHDVEQTKVFVQWLLDLGEGNIGGSNDGEATIEIPVDLLIMDSNDPVSDFIDFVYPSVIQKFIVATFSQERAILAPTNEVVDRINDRLLSVIPGDEKEYLSSDSICESENLQEGFDQSLYSLDVLNGLKISGSRVIEAEVISGSNIDKHTFIPIIALTPSDKKIPFKFKRRQFPIVIYVALSRVKSRDRLKLILLIKMIS
ncbi:uncharacterized protein LOC110893389 [Helianthus annuus]|uniref:uncharacterized protein LOC110893389 n=1 Tax=Helianthus annuus TaxID=4232 RepID=UPI000B90A47C|nr:uncharacterized protein LOC110893389 [Helianthus annuus]